jgi:ATP-binding cassette subfamily B protein
MDDLSGYASRPFAFYLRYVRLRPVRHAGIVLTGFAAALCAVGTQYAIKFLVDILSGAAPAHGNPWLASLLAADHLLSRISGVIASVTFPLVAADLRSDLFRHLSAQAPRYFADRLPGTLTSRITAASNAVVSLENMFSWNVLPPLVGNIGALAVLASISLPFTAGLVLVALAMVFVIYRLAAAARPLHRLFAEKAASVDGELVDIIGNMAIVRAFGGVARETRRVREALARETGTRRQSLLYMDGLRSSIRPWSSSS